MKSFVWILVAGLSLTACGGGGGGGGGGNPGPAPPSGIGSAGGTVNGPSGSRVVVPAGALSTNVAINVAQSSQGAPPLPAGMTGASEMFALTPHGTQFAAPVTITIPYDPAATNGAAPILYKTNAQNQWEPVNAATFASGMATAQISSFSYAQVVVPPLTRNEPLREWHFWLWPGDGSDVIVLDNDQQVGGDLDELIAFGESSALTAEFSTLTQTLLEDFEANGYAFGTNNGVTYGALAEAPDGLLGTPEPIGSTTIFKQSQSFKKNAADARLTYTITAVTIIAEDFNAPLLTGPAPLVGFVEFDLIGSTAQQTFYRTAGTASVFGANEHFFFEAETNGESQEMLWFPGKFEFLVEDAAFGPDSDPPTSCVGTRATLKLARPIAIPVDISQIDVGQEFTVHSLLTTEAHNRRGGRAAGDCQASYVGAYLRDPAEIGGTTIEFEGLEPTNNPLPLEQQPQLPPDEVQCTAATNPLPEAGVLQFEEASFAVDESPRAPRKVAITRTGGATGKVSVSFATSDGTATNGDDYTTTNTTVFFADGESGRRLVNVPIRRDIRAEGNETVQLALSQPGGCAALGGQATATLTIVDDSAIVPVPTFNVGGSVAGLEGSGLVIEERTTGVRVTPTENGEFAFVYRFPQGTPYSVRIATHPTDPLQTCAVNNANGVIGDSDVRNVDVVCFTQPPSGSLDVRFGSDGRVTEGLPAGADAIALQGDGKIVALGGNRLARYNDDGSVDTAFGTAGQVAVSFSGIQDEAVDVALQGDGKIIVIGVSRPGGINTRDDFAIARFNADGTLDSGFGTGGKAYVDFFGGHDEATAAIVQPDGAILVIGYAAIDVGGSEFDFAVVRLTAAGVLDTTFDSDGRTTADVAGELDQAHAVALQSNGAIVLAGAVRPDRSDPDDVGLARFTANGALDTTFGSGGTVHISYADDSDQADDLALQADGKIVIAGNALVGSTTDFLIARLNADGSRDVVATKEIDVRFARGSEPGIERAVSVEASDREVVASVDAARSRGSDD
ncbi:MAG TPA: Calx-beta domain-containing protein, partial [Steroidobacteraceae bacterium]|nr:Calx-beta domain-containing protein [Steroidobacteraceae bacterium]